jgi:hypothetical protein
MKKFNMKTLFDQETCHELQSRMNKLSSNSQALWGKMNVAQMLAHCKEAFKVPLMEKSPPRMFMGYLMGWMMKSKLYNETPWGKNLPTAPNFKITDDRNFEKEKGELQALVTAFNKANPAQVEKIVHPFFGKLTGEQWGKAMYKHMDHHLTQFGA